MALTENTLVSGYDLTATFGGYASALMQAIQRAIPESTFGMILVDSSTPDVSGSYEWRTRCLWIDTTDTAEPVLKAYRTTGSPGWFAVADAIANNSITTAMLQDGAVTLAKLSATGGTAAQLIRVNAGAAGFEFVNASDIVGGLGSVAITALDNTGVGATDELFVGCIGNTPGEVYWRDANDIAGLMSNAAVAPAKVGPATVLTTKTKFLSSHTGDTYGVYRVLDPDTDVDDGAINGDKLLDGSVVGGKLSNLSVSGAKIEDVTIDVTTKLVVPSSSALKILGINSGGTAWELQTGDSLFTSRQYATAAGSQVTFDPSNYGVHSATYTHGLVLNSVAAIPSQVRWVLIPAAAIGIAAAGDEIGIECFESSNGSRLLSCIANTTSISMASTVTPSGSWTFFGVNIVATTWKIKAYASL